MCFRRRPISPLAARRQPPTDVASADPSRSSPPTANPRRIDSPLSPLWLPPSLSARVADLVRSGRQWASLHTLETKRLEYLNRPNMFYLSEIEHTLRLPPSLLDLPLHDAIKGELEGLFLDKVIANLGLCISVYDIRSIDGGFIFPGDGASTYTVRFRLVMFRPFVGEVIVAKLKESDANGLRLSLGFFDDILIPAHLMPNPSHIEPDPENQKQLKWVWEFEGANYPIDEIDENVNYPKIPIEQEKLSTPIEEEKQSNPVKEKQSKPFAPMVITGSLDADGLGPVSWW
ncbi:uncharacterized protein LOC127786562 isoform X2 [Diospyros lotus]|uniref:uncharacterized protein LOC127786562 isoform X2 n=1 Tax=Diospyros lotus TaxID=55363 RepID=UPI002255C71B|nr:uncharacterized protein LOC127786562 isoform X2 [Diospyros lotus]